MTILIIIILTAACLAPDDLDQEMAARPAEAMTLARRAAAGLARDDPMLRQLFRKAAAVQEKHLGSLGEGQAAELADTLEKTLRDTDAARRVRRDWLRAREHAFVPSDAKARSDLARLWLRWLGDRKEAARLCKKALEISPDLTAAERLLRDELGYRRTETGWVADAEIPSGLRIGMTAQAVQQLLDRPQRVARQILYRRYLEQWTYEATGVLVEFDCILGQEPRVQSVRRTNALP